MRPWEQLPLPGFYSSHLHLSDQSVILELALKGSDSKGRCCQVSSVELQPVERGSFFVRLGLSITTAKGESSVSQTAFFCPEKNLTGLLSRLNYDTTLTHTSNSCVYTLPSWSVYLQGVGGVLAKLYAGMIQVSHFLSRSFSRLIH